MTSPRETGTSLLLTIAETAEELRISERSVYDLISAGMLPTCDLGTGRRARTRISRTALERFIEERTTARPRRGPTDTSPPTG